MSLIGNGSVTMGVGKGLIRVCLTGFTVLHVFALLPSTMQGSSPNIGVCIWISRAVCITVTPKHPCCYSQSKVFRYSR